MHCFFLVNRIALGLSYNGQRFHGWQSQPSGNTIQDHLERALARFAATGERITVYCAGRTDAGVHAIQQVVHFDTELTREDFSWVRGVNRYLPDTIALRWACHMPSSFHARHAAICRRYCYLLYDSATRPALGAGRVGWSFRPLNPLSMEQGAQHLLGTHDFSSFRAAECQARSPVKTLQSIRIRRQGSLLLCMFEADAFLHHMVRNIMGCLVAVGQGNRSPDWLAEVLAAKSRKVAAPTFAADGLYFLGPIYGSNWGGLAKTPELDLQEVLPLLLA